MRGHNPPFCDHAIGQHAGRRGSRPREGKAENYSEAMSALRPHSSGISHVDLPIGVIFTSGEAVTISSMDHNSPPGFCNLGPILEVRETLGTQLPIENVDINGVRHHL